MATENEEFYLEKKSYKFYIEFHKVVPHFIAIQRQRNIFFEKKSTHFTQQIILKSYEILRRLKIAVQSSTGSITFLHHISLLFIYWNEGQVAM